MSPPVPAPPARPSVLRNLSWLTLGSAIGKPLWFVFITAVCMRALGPAGYGVLASTLSLATILSLFTDLGTTTLAIRDVVSERETAGAYFANLFVARLGIGVLVVAAAPVFAALLGYGPEARAALLAASAYAVGLQLVVLCRVFYRAREVFHHEAASMIVERTAVIAGGVAALALRPTAASALTGMAVGVALALVLNAAWVHARLVRLDVRRLDGAFLRRAFRLALPLGAFSMFTVIYGRIGPVMLEALEGEVAAGLYGAAARLLELLIALPMVFSTVLLPRFTALRQAGDLAPFRRLIGQSLLGIVGFTAAVAAAVALAAPLLIHLLDPDPAYAAAGPLLRALIWVFPLIGGTMVLTQVLIAENRLRWIAGLMAAGLAVFVALNLVLIPALGTMGTVWAFLATEAGLLVALGLAYRTLLATTLRTQPAPSS